VPPLLESDDSTLLVELLQKFVSESSWAGKTLPNTLTMIFPFVFMYSASNMSSTSTNGEYFPIR